MISANIPIERNNRAPDGSFALFIIYQIPDHYHCTLHKSATANSVDDADETYRRISFVVDPNHLSQRT